MKITEQKTETRPALLASAARKSKLLSFRAEFHTDGAQVFPVHHSNM